jgi:hypothetical protein
MSATDRQNRLLVAEDWKRVYQTFRNADFQSYDFDNLRRTMINYLRTNYPEDFNDYIESSEYLALIDLIAFLGQNLAFRIDLNARENFLELAERRESVLRLARLLNYNPRRNQAANGLLKITSVSTTEDVIDSNGRNLQAQTILWNDSTNTNWYEQFVKVLNTALPVNGVFGRPNKKEMVGGVATEQYRVNGVNTDVPVFSFEKPVEGKSTGFEIVSTDIDDGNIQEEPPIPGNNFAFLYRDDAQGAGSSNSGFFAHFRQGRLENGQFSITQPVPNQTVAIDATNINDSDVWLYKLDSNNNEVDSWTKVDAVEGNNVIYNSLNKKIRDIYSVLTRIDDRINLIFSDGVFGSLPKGTFRTYYRVSENRGMVISPAALTNISINIPYLSKTGKVQELTLTMSLQYSVSNSAASESNLSIKQNAPATYYTQNRMITGEDYNVAPLGVSQDIIKVKSVNRISSGISRYFDLIDSTGKYSSTNLYGNDGIIYKEYTTDKTSFTFQTQTDIEGVIINNLEPILDNRRIKHFYLDKFSKILTLDLGVKWKSVSNHTNTFTGFFEDSDQQGFNVGTFTSNTLRYVEAGTSVKFQPPAGYAFTSNNELIDVNNSDNYGVKQYIWTKVLAVAGNGLTTNLSTTTGPIALADRIPEGSNLVEIKPRLASSLLDDVKIEMIDQIFAYNDFGLRYDINTQTWRVIKATNLNKINNFSNSFTGDKTNSNIDSSWLILFETNGETYTITYRGLRYVFESDEEIRFYYDSSDKIYDSKTGQVLKDKISVLSINTQPNSTQAYTQDYSWEVMQEYRDAEGYVDSTKIEVTFKDADEDGVIDDPQIFTELVSTDQTVILEKYRTEAGTEDYRYIDYAANNIEVIDSNNLEQPISSYTDGTILYFKEGDFFRIVNASIPKKEPVAGYRAFNGRANLKFHYVHVADYNARIDPSASNLIDVFMLTKNYDRSYRLYLDGQLPTAPLPPSPDELFRSYGSSLNKIKSISDEVIYHPVKYKPLFGSEATSDLQAVFKIVKNPDQVINDSDLKTRTIEAINQYFSLENWDFGDTFYFQELATYVMNRLSPDLVTFVIVPKQVTQSFGSLFEIRSESDEIFINSASVAEIDIITEVTASRLSSTGTVVTATNTQNIGLQSS